MSLPVFLLCYSGWVSKLLALERESALLTLDFTFITLGGKLKSKKGTCKKHSFAWTGQIVCKQKTTESQKTSGQVATSGPLVASATEAVAEVTEVPWCCSLDHCFFGFYLQCFGLGKTFFWFCVGTLGGKGKCKIGVAWLWLWRGRAKAKTDSPLPFLFLLSCPG